MTTTFTIKPVANSRTGNAHQTNEDSWWLPSGEWPSPTQIEQYGYLAVLSDGVGGHAAGSTASRLAVEVSAQAYYTQPMAAPTEALPQALYAAQQQILQQAQQPGYKDMAATAVLAVVQGQTLTLAHLGDSRAYLWREGQLQRLTADHSWVAEQLARGILTPQEAAEHPNRGVLSRALGVPDGFQPEVRQYTLAPGDRVLLCSDGVWDVLEAELPTLLAQEKPQQIVNSLMNRVDAHQGQDDATAILLAFDPPRQSPLANLNLKTSRFLVLGLVLALLLVGGGFFAGSFFNNIGDNVGNVGVPSATATASPTTLTAAGVEPTSTPFPPTPTATTLPLPTSTTLPPTPTPPLPENEQAQQPPPANPETQPQYCVAQVWQSRTLNPTYLIRGPDQSRYAGGQEISPGTLLEGANPSMLRAGLADDTSNLFNFVQVQYQGQTYWMMATHLGTQQGDRCINLNLPPAP